MTKLLTIRQAAEKGIERVHAKKWANPLDHLKINVACGALLPWSQFYSPMNMAMLGCDPKELLITQVGPNRAEWEPYLGPLPDSDEYKAAVAAFNAQFGGVH